MDASSPSLRRRRRGEGARHDALDREPNNESSADESGGLADTPQAADVDARAADRRHDLMNLGVGRGGPRPSIRTEMSRSSVHRDETRRRKVVTRIASSLIMITLFVGILLSGHAYVCALVFVLEVLLFRELVTVRYHAFFDRIEETIPLFRTTQWLWFAVSIFYAYSEFAVEMIKSNPKLHDLFEYAQLAPLLSFILYTGTFVLTIGSMQTGHIRFQLNQLCWTIVVLCITVGQLKWVMHNIYNGLIWFTLPILLVTCNDVGAYFAGITCGRKFIQRSLVSFSPNKTWEGFIGGGVVTVITGWYLSRFLARFSWMTCPTNRVTLFPTKLDCEVENIFVEATSHFPSQVFALFPRAVIRSLPNVVEICSMGGDSAALTPCISGAPHQRHHHWEMALTIVPIQLHAISLSLFASLVAPFGGFLASAIKRAYGIKDFDSIIPGHGGLTDRFDCQFIMSLYTWVHYNTFVKITTVSVAKLLYMYRLLGEDERQQFLEKLAKME
mmetsp:Transcript_22244/g.52552  ORF Transcript_22244/g.52552 Transcript_22244/m.52552 type:complete len:500 (-) Transcript_22244:74-1573(-)